MPDWQKLVRERLAQGKHAARIDPEVAEELAHHLEDAYSAGLEAGRSEEESIRAAQAEVKSWPRLARRINQARGGNTMIKQRIQRLWLPGIATMLVAFALLLGSQRLSMQPSMTAISTRISAYFYLAWLAILPAMGALAALWSRRSGGTAANRAAAALFPAFTMLAMYLAVAGLTLFSDRSSRDYGQFRMLLSAAVGGVLFPTMALLAGALPFLRKGPALPAAPGDKLTVGAA